MTVAYLFPGQGAQVVGMGRATAERCPPARDLFRQADDLLGFSLSALCFDGPTDDLTATANQQPALFVVGMAHWTELQTADRPPPAWLAGHSLGELTALTAAGSLSFAAGLHLVRQRGLLMARSGARQAGGMAAVMPLPVEEVAGLCAQATAETGQPVVVANDNCPGQVVISGADAALARALTLAQAAGARRIVRLPISIASHSPLMADVQAELAAVIADLPVNAPRIPVLSAATAEPLAAPRRIRAALVEQLTRPVNWTATVRALLGRGVQTFVDVGPGEVLAQLVKRIERTATRLAFDPATAELSPV